MLQSAQIEEPRSSAKPKAVPTGESPRDLIGDGKYVEAVAAYNGLIANEPRQFTHFLGRARALFLLGDVSGALKDLNEAHRLKPGSPIVASVQRAIEGTDVEHDKTALRRGHVALESGDGAAALGFYTEAEKSGFDTLLSRVNQSMAYILKNEPQAAQATLSTLYPFQGSSLWFVVGLLNAICEFMEGRLSVRQAQMLLNTGLATTFSYQKSFIPFFEIGVSRTGALSEDTRGGILAIIGSIHS